MENALNTGSAFAPRYRSPNTRLSVLVRRRLGRFRRHTNPNQEPYFWMFAIVVFGALCLAWIHHTHKAALLMSEDSVVRSIDAGR